MMRSLVRAFAHHNAAAAAAAAAAASTRLFPNTHRPRWLRAPPPPQCTAAPTYQGRGNTSKTKEPNPGGLGGVGWVGWVAATGSEVQCQVGGGPGAGAGRAAPAQNLRLGCSLASRSAHWCGTNGAAHNARPHKHLFDRHDGTGRGCVHACPACLGRSAAVRGHASPDQAFTLPSCPTPAPPLPPTDRNLLGRHETEKKHGAGAANWGTEGAEQAE